MEGELEELVGPCGHGHAANLTERYDGDLTAVASGKVIVGDVGADGHPEHPWGVVVGVDGQVPASIQALAILAALRVEVADIDEVILRQGGVVLFVVEVDDEVVGVHREACGGDVDAELQVCADVIFLFRVHSGGGVILRGVR